MRWLASSLPMVLLMAAVMGGVSLFVTQALQGVQAWWARPTVTKPVAPATPKLAAPVAATPPAPVVRAPAPPAAPAWRAVTSLDGLRDYVRAGNVLTTRQEAGLAAHGIQVGKGAQAIVEIRDKTTRLRLFNSARTHTEQLAMAERGLAELREKIAGQPSGMSPADKNRLEYYEWKIADARAALALHRSWVERFHADSAALQERSMLPAAQDYIPAHARPLSDMEKRQAAAHEAWLAGLPDGHKQARERAREALRQR